MATLNCHMVFPLISLFLLAKYIFTTIKHHLIPLNPTTIIIWVPTICSSRCTDWNISRNPKRSRSQGNHECPPQKNPTHTHTKYANCRVYFVLHRNTSETKKCNHIPKVSCCSIRGYHAILLLRYIATTSYTYRPPSKFAVEPEQWPHVIENIRKLIFQHFWGLLTLGFLLANICHKCKRPFNSGGVKIQAIVI